MTSIVDINGFKQIKDNPISKVGVFPYLGKDLPGAEDPLKVYQVYRPEEELSDPACIESFKLLPWIDNHTMLGDDLTPAEEKGIHGVLGQDVYYKDGELRANLKIFSAMLSRLIESGKKDLSCGYRCVYEKVKGVFNGQPYDFIQRKIRGNHLALVDEGRMGPQVAVLDGLDTTYIFTIDSQRVTDMADPINETPNGEESKPSEMTLAELIAVVKEIVPQIAAINQALSALAPVPESAPAPVAENDEECPTDTSANASAMDSKVKSLEKRLKEVESAGAKTIINEINARESLYGGISKIVGAFDHSAMTSKEIAEYGIKKLNLTCSPGAEVDVIRGYISAMDASVTKNKSNAVGQKQGSPKNSAIKEFLSGAN